MNVALITTMPNDMFDVYGRKMLESFVKFWPQEIPLLVQLDDDLLYPEVDKILRPQDGIAVGHNKDHADFVARNKDKDDPQNYRKQPVRFCHKVFALHRAMDAALKQKEVEDSCRYLVWMDADVITTRPVTFDDVAKCLPKEGDAVAYLGRKDWDHSECGWLAFDLEKGGDYAIKDTYNHYIDDSVLDFPQQHDSWVFDEVRKRSTLLTWTNLTEGKPGTEIWEQSPMAEWSVHYKGPRAKQALSQTPEVKGIPKVGQNYVIQTKNAISDEQIWKHIEENQSLITNWLGECEANDETITIASAGPQLVAEDLREEKGKIVAVKHALSPLRKAGITPWACILLDPRPHVLDFVQDADKDVKWFVASQVNPSVTKALLEKGCEVWGYHASVGANEGHLTCKQQNAVVNGGSATATRGLHLLAHLGFRNFHLYGYELSYPDKPDLKARDNLGQPKYMEFSVGVKDQFVDVKRHFFSEPQLIAQYEEMTGLIQSEKYNLKAFGEGLVPFMLKYTNLSRLRQAEIKCMMGGKLSSYNELFEWNRKKKTKSSAKWRKLLQLIRRKRTVKSK